MKFIIDVPEGNTPHCEICPFNSLEYVCQYIGENGICGKYDFTKLNIEELNDTN